MFDGTDNSQNNYSDQNHNMKPPTIEEHKSEAELESEKPQKEIKQEMEALSISDNFRDQNFMESQKKRGRKAKYEGAEYPDLIDKAKLILPQHNYNIDKILELEEFKQLKGSRDLTKFISKFILNKICSSHAKSQKQQSLCSRMSQKTPPECLNNQEISIKPQQNLEFIHQNGEELINQLVNQGAKAQSEITSAYIREFILASTEDRQDLLWKIFQRNSQSLLEFLQSLKSAAPDQITQDLFRSIYELNLRADASIMVKSRLFVHSLLYYCHEVIDVDEQLLKSSLQILSYRPNTEQVLGLANYIFINEPESLRNLEQELQKVDQVNIGIIPLMQGTFQLFKIDNQVIKLIPNTLLSLNKAFIQILKEDQGLRLIRDIPAIVVSDFIQICALSTSYSYLKLDKLIKEMNEIFIQKWDFIDQNDFIYFLKLLASELKRRNPLWVSKVDEMIELARNLSYIYHEKGIRFRKDIIDDCLKADFTKLNQLLHIPNKAVELGSEEQKQLFKTFFKLNKENEAVDFFKQFSVIEAFRETDILKKCSKYLGFNYLSIQKLCLNFLQNLTFR